MSGKHIMNYDLHIKNIGKLTDAQIRVGQFTVFAGQNNTGKSFASKILYSLFSADTMNINLEAVLHLKKMRTMLVSGIERKLRENLLQNFQVPHLCYIRGKGDGESEIDMGAMGKFKFTDKEVSSNINTDWLIQLQQYANIIYMESPVYTKLKDALENLYIYNNFSDTQRDRLNVPKYFYDLAHAYEYDYDCSSHMDFRDLYNKLIGKDVINGKFVVSKNGNILFEDENGRNFDMPVTGKGVAKFAMLAMLMEFKVLNKKSMLFIDEPEAHLHPAWQVVMADALFELAKGGVTVVISTHSADILKWLEVHIKKNPDDEGLVALNQFPCGGSETDSQNFGDKMAAIKQELTKPFADLYTAGL